MNWRRGLTRMYLVVWFLWASLWLYGGVLSRLHHGRSTESYVRRVSIHEYNLEEANDPFHLVPWTKVGDDSMESESSREVGEPRLHFDPPVTFAGVLGTLAMAFLVPAAILGTLRWIVAGFRGPGAGAQD